MSALKHIFTLGILLMVCVGVFENADAKTKSKAPTKLRIHEIDSLNSDLEAYDYYLTSPQTIEEWQKSVDEDIKQFSKKNKSGKYQAKLDTLDAERKLAYDPDKARKVRENTLLKCDSLIVTHCILDIIYNRYPGEDVINQALHYVDMVESDCYKSFAQDYKPMLRNYKAYKDELFNFLKDNQVINKALLYGYRLSVEEEKKVKAGLKETKYYAYYQTKDRDDVVSISYLDDVVDSILDLAKQMKTDITEENKERFREKRKAILEKLY